MSDPFSPFRDELDHLERQALDNSDQLFAIAYLRSHLDLLSAEDSSSAPLEALTEAVESTFEADNMSDIDRSAVRSLINQLGRTQT